MLRRVLIYFEEATNQDKIISCGRRDRKRSGVRAAVVSDGRDRDRVCVVTGRSIAQKELSLMDHPWQ